MRGDRRQDRSGLTAVVLLVLVAAAIIAGGLALDAARAAMTGSGSRGTPRAGHPVVVPGGALALSPDSRGPS